MIESGLATLKFSLHLMEIAKCRAKYPYFHNIYQHSTKIPEEADVGERAGFLMYKNDETTSKR